MTKPQAAGDAAIAPDATLTGTNAEPIGSDTEQPRAPTAEDISEKVAERRTDEAAGETGDAAQQAEESTTDKSGRARRRVNWSRVLAYGLLPGLALLLTAGAGFLKWQDSSVRAAEFARMESVQAAKDSTIALLSYKPDTVDKQLGAARDLLTGEFRNSYTSLTNDVVIPGAKQQQISALAKVVAAASVSASPSRAVVLVFIDQAVTAGNSAPSDTASSVRVTLDKVGERWLISAFDPV